MSVPVTRTNRKIKLSIKKRIENGTYNVGVPVVDTEISKLTINNDSEVVQRKINVQARKIPFKEKTEALMGNKGLLKVRDDGYYNKLTKEELEIELKKIHEEINDDIEETRKKLKKYQCQRHWLLWHDHSTIANYGHVVLFLRAL